MAAFRPEGFSRQIEDLGVPAQAAAETAGRINPLMKDCILRLYRSAVTVGQEWQPDLAKITSPGLVFWGISDPACPIEFAERLGADTRAERVVKLDCGHWTPLQKSAEIARALQAHWAAA